MVGMKKIINLIWEVMLEIAEAKQERMRQQGHKAWYY